MGFPLSIGEHSNPSATNPSQFYDEDEAIPQAVILCFQPSVYEYAKESHDGYHLDPDHPRYRLYTLTRTTNLDEKNEPINWRNVPNSGPRRMNFESNTDQTPESSLSLHTRHHRTTPESVDVFGVDVIDYSRVTSCWTVKMDCSYRGCRVLAFLPTTYYRWTFV